MRISSSIRWIIFVAALGSGTVQAQVPFERDDNFLFSWQSGRLGFPTDQKFYRGVHKNRENMHFRFLMATVQHLLVNEAFIHTDSGDQVSSSVLLDFIKWMDYEPSSEIERGNIKKYGAFSEKFRAESWVEVSPNRDWIRFHGSRLLWRVEKRDEKGNLIQKGGDGYDYLVLDLIFRVNLQRVLSVEYYASQGMIVPTVKKDFIVPRVTVERDTFNHVPFEPRHLDRIVLKDGKAYDRFLYIDPIQVCNLMGMPGDLVLFDNITYVDPDIEAEANSDHSEEDGMTKSQVFRVKGGKKRDAIGYARNKELVNAWHFQKEELEKKQTAAAKADEIAQNERDNHALAVKNYLAAKRFHQAYQKLKEISDLIAETQASQQSASASEGSSETPKTPEILLDPLRAEPELELDEELKDDSAADLNDLVPLLNKETQSLVDKVLEEDHRTSIGELLMTKLEKASLFFGEGYSPAGYVAITLKEVLALSLPTFDYTHVGLLAQINGLNNFYTLEKYPGEEKIIFSGYPTHGSVGFYRADRKFIERQENCLERGWKAHDIPGTYSGSGFCSDYVNWACEDFHGNLFTSVPLLGDVLGLVPFWGIDTPDDFKHSWHTTKLCVVDMVENEKTKEKEATLLSPAVGETVDLADFLDKLRKAAKSKNDPIRQHAEEVLEILRSRGHLNSRGEPYAQYLTFEKLQLSPETDDNDPLPSISVDEAREILRRGRR